MGCEHGSMALACGTVPGATVSWVTLLAQAVLEALPTAPPPDSPTLGLEPSPPPASPGWSRSPGRPATSALNSSLGDDVAYSRAKREASSPVRPHADHLLPGCCWMRTPGRSGHSP